MGSCGELLDLEDDDVFARLIRKMNTPRVVIDNDSCDNATVVRVHSVKKHGILLEMIQVLIDLNLVITKAYISSDGSWFMDVFNVTNCEGNKIWDKEVLTCIQTSLETDLCFLPSLRSSIGVVPSWDHTSIELTGTDRPGLLSELCAVLTDLRCNVVRAEVWTHNTRAAAVLHVTDESTGLAIEDLNKLSTIKELLCNVLKSDGDSKAGKMTVSMGLTHTERRLHQLMSEVNDYEQIHEGNESSIPQVTVMDCTERDYIVVILRSKDRPKLFFDTICTLTDMNYTVYHGTVDTGNEEAYQEYYIRHVNGVPINSESERQRMVQCLQAAIARRASEGLELELRTEDRAGVLSDITRIFRENGLCIKRAEIATEDGKLVGTFHAPETSGSNVDAKTIEAIRKQLGQTVLRVKNTTSSSTKPPEENSSTGFLFGNLFKGCSFQSFRMITLELTKLRRSIRIPHCE